jgi:anti-anti-sigma factor
MTTAKLNVEHHDVGPVMYLSGDVDLSNSDALRSQILPTVPAIGPGMVLDLTQATYLDSSGVRLLFDLAEGLHARHQRLVLVVSEAAIVRRVVVLTKLEDAVALVETVGDGLELLHKV